MGTYLVNSDYWTNGSAYDIIAKVYAKNSESAKAQLDWLLCNTHCMCNDCRESWREEYSVDIDSLPVYMPQDAYCKK